LFHKDAVQNEDNEAAATTLHGEGDGSPRLTVMGQHQRLFQQFTFLHTLILFSIFYNKNIFT